MAGQPLVIPVGASVRDLERAMRQASKLTDKTATEIEERFKRVDLSLAFGANVLKGALGAFSVDRVIRGLADANAQLVQMGETAKRVGLDLQRFQELQFAGRTNGLTGQQFGTGVEGLAERLNEMRQIENSLSKLLDDNNVKYRDRKGEVFGVNDALGQVANLVRNAATEFDKIKIAEAAGLTREWVPLLEQGADAINRQAAAAKEAGAVIDSDVIQKAKEFERSWAAAVERWSALIKSNAGALIGVIDTLIAKAAQLGGSINAALGDYSRRLQAVQDIESNGIAGASRGSLEWVIGKGREFGVTDSDLSAATKRLEELRELQRETDRAQGPAPLSVSVNKRPDRPTNTSSLFSKGGGGGGKSEEEQAQDRLDRYIETLMRQNAVLDAEIATFGRSNAEKRAAVELAKAQVDLAKLDEAERAKIIASLTREIELSEQKRTKLAELKQAQEGLNDSARSFGNAAIDALEDFVVNGAKAEDIAKRLAVALAKAALQAAFLGQGPLAGVFGTGGTGGNLGGILGMLFGGVKAASGGYIAGRGTGTSDSIPARLSNGEFVVNASATRRHRDLLEAINGGQVQTLASGGFVSPPPVSMPRTSEAGGLTVNVQNNTPAQVETRPRADGGIDMIISQVEGAMAQRMLRGQGSLSQAFAARQTNRHLRG